MTRLILGTAQFGDAYGVTNRRGRIDDEGVAAVLEVARAAGIDTFDTAADYGDSQQRLGALRREGDRFITKFALPDDGALPDQEQIYRRSMRMLGVDRLEGVMFHRVADLRDERCAAVVELLRDARMSGEVGRIGVSIYDVDDLRVAQASFPDLDLLQYPGSILDGRLLEEPELRELQDSGVELHVRSAFLQGLLLTPPSAMPPGLEELAPRVDELGRIAVASQETVLGIALRYLRDHPRVDGVVVGALAPAELAAITLEWGGAGISAAPMGSGLAPRLLDPRLWNLPA